MLFLFATGHCREKDTMRSRKRLGATEKKKNNPPNKKGLGFIGPAFPSLSTLGVVWRGMRGEGGVGVISFSWLFLRRQKGGEEG